MFNYSIVFCCVIISSLMGFSQVTTNSPYSANNLGLWEEPQDGYTLGKGGSQIATNDSMYANSYNPASLAFLAHGQPIFSFDIAGRYSDFSSETDNSTNQFGYLRGIQIAIPFGNRFGIAAGMRPTISRGYDFKMYQEIAGDSIRHSYIGSGGIRQTYISLAAALIKNKRHFLSLGLESGYIFGSTTNTRVTEFPQSNNLFNGAYRTSNQINSFDFRLGLSYQLELSKNSSIALGVTYHPQNDWKTKNSETLTRFVGTFGVSQSDLDTVSFTGIREGVTAIPSRLGFGFNYEIRAKADSTIRRTNLYRVRFMGDFEQMKWSEYAVEIPGVLNENVLPDALHVRFGIEYTPHFKSLDKATNIKYLSKVSYRIGGNYNQIPTSTDLINDFGITFGLGFPIPFSRSMSSLNLGVKLGQQGEVGPSSIKEQYAAFHFGIILTPGFNERWFRKFKYD